MPLGFVELDSMTTDAVGGASTQAASEVQDMVREIQAHRKLAQNYGKAFSIRNFAIAMMDHCFHPISIVWIAWRGGTRQLSNMMLFPTFESGVRT